MTQIDDAEAGSLRFRLRLATGPAHHRLEAVVAIQDRCERRDSYLNLVARLWGIYAPLEDVLARVDWSAVDIDFSARSKARWLAEDLLSLGLAKDRLSTLPRAGRLPTVADLADAMGVLYVLEGASLGGQVIMRRLKADLAITEHRGGRFYMSYGPAVGQMWRAYVTVLESFGAPPSVAARIERAAQETFDCFLDWFGKDASPPVRMEGRQGVH